jgi:hypothetical protein
VWKTVKDEKTKKKAQENRVPDGSVTAELMLPLSWRRKRV